MQINVAQLLREHVGSSREYYISEPVDIFGDGREYPVVGDVLMLRTNRSILARAKFDTVVGLTCSRCLGTFEAPVSVEFDEEYFPTLDVATGSQLDIPEEPGQFTIDEHHIINLTEALRQYILMTVPMKPLCAAGCAGLCPVCGKNLNTGRCGCPEKETDPRWSKLKDLM